MSNTPINNSIPRNIEECTQPDIISTRLWDWAQWLEKWGKRLLIFFIVYGVIYAILDFIEMNKVADTETAISVGFSSLLLWGLYAIIEYCAYNATALLIKALASITQNVSTSTRIAIFCAANGSNPSEESKMCINESSDQSQEDVKEIVENSAPKAENIPTPEQEPQPKKAAKKAVDTTPSKTAGLGEHLNYALQYSTDDGMKRYLNGVLEKLSVVEQEELKLILAAPQAKLRATVNDYLSSKKEV